MKRGHAQSSAVATATAASNAWHSCLSRSVHHGEKRLNDVEEEHLFRSLCAAIPCGMLPEDMPVSTASLAHHLFRDMLEEHSPIGSENHGKHFPCCRPWKGQAAEAITHHYWEQHNTRQEIDLWPGRQCDHSFRQGSAKTARPEKCEMQCTACVALGHLMRSFSVT